MIHSHLVNTSKFYGLMYFVLTPENAQTIQLIYDHSCQKAHLYDNLEVNENIIVDRICTSINSVDTSNCLLLGDFNFRQINWNKMEAKYFVSVRNKF
jgi:hypothetical protein